MSGEKRLDIRLIALDLDGTLLTSSKSITEYTKHILKEASDRGIHVVISTGRTLNGVQKILAELPFVRYVSLANGAVVQDVKTGEVISRVPLPAGKMTEFIALAHEKGFYCDCFIDGEGASGPGFAEFVAGVPVDEHTKKLLLTSRSETPDFEALVTASEGNIEKANMLFQTEELRLEMADYIKKDPELIGTTPLYPNLK